VVNVTTSTMARESTASRPTLAGTEVGRRLDQGLHLPAHGAALPRHRGRAGPRRAVEADEKGLVDALLSLPGLLSEALKREAQIEGIARELSKAKDVLYFGRGTAYPLALEGALKLKEISYIHAEGYAAGELKHGPIALIDETLPVIVLAPHDHLFEKTVSNMQEVAARGGRIILVTDDAGAEGTGLDTMATVLMPNAHPAVAPIVYAIPVQLLAYHTAVFMGKDVDQPRNLAKSVTVE
jgi:glucosamine--fructose-6-phosphate aminotransferase (isomerizing)